MEAVVELFLELRDDVPAELGAEPLARVERDLREREGPQLHPRQPLARVERDLRAPLLEQEALADDEQPVDLRVHRRLAVAALALLLLELLLREHAARLVELEDRVERHVV